MENNMPLFDSAFWIQMIVYAVSFGTVYGTITTKLKYLEAKVDKHNSVVERMYKAEESVKSAHHRIDEIREEL